MMPPDMVSFDWTEGQIYRIGTPSAENEWSSKEKLAWCDNYIDMRMWEKNHSEDGKWVHFSHHLAEVYHMYHDNRQCSQQVLLIVNNGNYRQMYSIC